MKDNLLYNALRLARKKKYGHVISLMESEILRYRDSFRFYYILALSCLRTGDFGRAYTYFKSAHDIKQDDVHVLLGIAALNVRRGESARAIDMYFKALAVDKQNKTAVFALAVLKKYGGSEELHDWVNSGKINKIYPPFPKIPFNIKRFLCTALIVLGSAAAAGGIIFTTAKYFLPSVLPQKTLRAGFSDSELSSADKQNLVETGGAYKIILTKDEVLKTYEAARKNFILYNDNIARYNINKLLLSNCSEGIKNKAKELLKYMIQPDFAALKDNFNYKDVEKESSLYLGCYVIWSGMTESINIESNTTYFNLLVGYEEKKVLLGIVPVRCDFAFDIDNERPLEVLGRIITNKDSFALEGISIHQK